MMAPNLKAINHNCPGTSLHEISHLQMRLFTKEKLDYFSAKMLGDVDPYQRIIQRKRKFGAVGGVGEYPEELKKNENF